MAEVSKETLKTYFEDGKEPDENKFIDLIDTMAIVSGVSGDYGLLSTIVGFASFTKKSIFYKREGSLVFIDYHLAGISGGVDGTVLTFTLPFGNNTDVTFQSPITYVLDNGVAVMSGGRTRLPASSAIVTAYRTMTSPSWTPTGNKTITGQFWYEAT